MYLSLHIYNSPRFIEHNSNCYVIRMPAAVSHNSVSRNVLLKMYFFCTYIHVHCITYNSEKKQFLFFVSFLFDVP